MEYIGKISALIEESLTNNVAIESDFNAAIDTQFDVELQKLCNNLSLVISDCNYYDRNSGMFTHVRDAHSIISWLVGPCTLQSEYANKITFNCYPRYVTQL